MRTWFALAYTFGSPMNSVSIKQAGRLALVVIALCGLTSFCEEPKTAVLRIRVGHKDCKGGALCGNRDSLLVSAHGKNVWGWDDSVPLAQTQVAEGKAGWHLFDAPVGARIAISAFYPPHALVEKWIEIKSTDQRDVTILLESPEPELLAKVDVALPKDAESWEDGYLVLIKARETGHRLDNTTVDAVRKGFALPKGKYEVEVRGILPPWCGNGRPIPENHVRDHADLMLGDDGSTRLQLQKGGALGMSVNLPDGHKTEMKLPPGTEPILLGSRWGGDRQDWLRARLVSKETQQVHELEWGWDSLHFAIPRSEFPSNTKTYQITPVPYGQYELIIRGQSIQEYRQEVTFAPGKPVELRITPELRAAEPKSD